MVAWCAASPPAWPCRCLTASRHHPCAAVTRGNFVLMRKAWLAAGAQSMRRQDTSLATSLSFSSVGGSSGDSREISFVGHVLDCLEGDLTTFGEPFLMPSCLQSGCTPTHAHDGRSSGGCAQLLALLSGAGSWTLVFPCPQCGCKLWCAPLPIYRSWPEC